MLKLLLGICCSFLVFKGLSQPSEAIEWMGKNAKWPLSDKFRTTYFKFYDDVQLIQVHLLEKWATEVSFMESSYPRALSWSMVIPSPKFDLYILRHRSGKIIKTFNHDLKDFKSIKLLSAKKCNAHTVPHTYQNSIKSSGFYVFTEIFSKTRNSANLNSNKQGIFDSLGNVVLSNTFDCITPVNSSFLVLRDTAYQLLNKELKPLPLPKHDYLRVSYAAQGYINYNQKKHLGLIDPNGTVILPAKYESIEKIGSLFKVKRNNKFGLTDLNGRRILSPKYYQINYPSEGFIPIQKKYKWGFANMSGEEVIKCQFSNVSAFKNGRSIATMRSSVDITYSSAVIDTVGNYIVPFNTYKSISNFHNGMAIVMDFHANYGAINTKGELTVPLVYKRIQHFDSNGIAQAKKNLVWIHIDTNGTKVSKP